MNRAADLDIIGMMEMQVVEELFMMLEQFDEEPTPDSIEHSCGYMKLYDGREVQMTVRLNTNEDEWI